jgi:hypothetical protein
LIEDISFQFCLPRIFSPAAEKAPEGGLLRFKGLEQSFISPDCLVSSLAIFHPSQTGSIQFDERGAPSFGFLFGTCATLKHGYSGQLL